MKNLRVLTLSTILATSLFAIQEQNLDYISISMGGAGVASSIGSMSAYINPALINNKDNKRTEIGLSIGAGLQEYQLGDPLNQLDEADVGDTLDRIANGEGDNPTVKQNALNIQDALSNLSNKNNYLLISPTAGLSFKIGEHFALGVYAFADAKAKAIVDGNKLDYIYYDETYDVYIKYDPNTGKYSQTTQSDYETNSVEYAMDNGETYLKVNAISIIEIPITYANNFQYKDISINWGISAKYMRGTTSYTDIKFTDDDYDPLSNLDDNEVETSTFGIDLGAVIQPNDSRFKLGISAKNINTPSFDTITGEKYKLKPKITTGIAYSINDLVDVAIDYDITETTDELVNQSFRYIGGGVNFHPVTWFSIRAGLKKNLADSNNYNGTIYTAGASIGLKWLQIDASIQASQNEGSYDGTTLPRYLKANLAIVSKWGDN